MMGLRVRAGCLFAAAVCLVSSCSPLSPAPFKLGIRGGAAETLYTDSRLPKGTEATAGGAGKASVVYSLGKPILLPGDDPALEIRYRIQGSGHLDIYERTTKGKPALSLDLARGQGEIDWILPLPKGFRLAALRFTTMDPPVSPREGGAPGMTAESSAGSPASRVEILGVEARPAEYGFEMTAGGARFSRGSSLTRSDEAASESIRVDHPYRPEAPVVVELRARKGRVSLSSQGGRTAVVSFAKQGVAYIPLSALGGQGSITAQAGEKGALEAVLLRDAKSLEAPLSLDLGTILALPPAGEQDSPYALYRWDVFPNTLIFDFRDYATQDAYLKRLAFFVEKEGYRGRLAGDVELSRLHGWNAHDYRPEDLAAFFYKAQKISFTLSREENELRSILEKSGILVNKDGRILPGTGAIVSISRESSAYFRRLFLNHEATHALFFQDESYRGLANSLWRSMGAEERRFWNVFLSNRDYEPDDAYLSYNEFQAYMTQQSVSQLEDWLKNVAFARLAKSYPDRAPAILADLQASIEGFKAKAAALDAYLKKTYGLSAGALERVRIK